MAWSSWYTAGNVHVNSFGTYSQFWLITEYRHNRSGNTVNYQVKLSLKYVNTDGGTGSYGWPTEVALYWDGTTYRNQITYGGDWYNGETVSKTYDVSIINTTGSGSVYFTSYVNRVDTSSDQFDHPGPYGYYASIPQMDTYTISYNANGGTGAPSNQTKYYNTTLVLTSSTPSKSATTTTGVTITYNGNNGSVIGNSSVTNIKTMTYSFYRWNTNSDGTGTSYSPGGNYTANAGATLYAQWNTSSTTYSSVTLPSGFRNGYVLLGWSTNSAATAPDTGKTVGANFTTSANTTLYAVWQQKSVILKIAPEVFDLMYPIGYIYISTASIDPGTLFGMGTWVRFAKGRTLVGIDENDTDFDTVNKTAGSKAMQKHSHTKGTMNITGSYTISDDSDNASFDASTYGSGAITAKNNAGYASTAAGSGGGTWLVAKGFDFNAANNWTGSTSEEGTGTSGNLQPYITVYMWERTA